MGRTPGWRARWPGGGVDYGEPRAGSQPAWSRGHASEQIPPVSEPPSEEKPRMQAGPPCLTADSGTLANEVPQSPGKQKAGNLRDEKSFVLECTHTNYFP